MHSKPVLTLASAELCLVWVQTQFVKIRRGPASVIVYLGMSCHPVG